MFCSNCGKETRDGTKFCPYCGVALSQDVSAWQPAPSMGDEGKAPIPQSKKIKCPNCNGHNLQITTEVTTTGGGYSGTKGCLGFLLLGPCGLLCGNCGSKQSTSGRTYWVCADCGHKFRNLSEWKEEIESNKKLTIFCFVFSVFMLCVMMVGSVFGEEIPAMFIAIDVLWWSMTLSLYLLGRKAVKAYEILERKSKE